MNDDVWEEYLKYSARIDQRLSDEIRLLQMTQVHALSRAMKYRVRSRRKPYLSNGGKS